MTRRRRHAWNMGETFDRLEKKGIPQESTIVRLPEGIARPLIAIQDEEIKDKAISSILKALESGKNPITGEFSV